MMRLLYLGFNMVGDWGFREEVSKQERRRKSIGRKEIFLANIATKLSNTTDLHNTHVPND